MHNNNNPSHAALLRRPEACRLLGIGPSTYKMLVARGVLREVAVGERGRRLPYVEVERYISERLATAEPPA
jgi:excisionase family DNA binding protein